MNKGHKYFDTHCHIGSRFYRTDAATDIRHATRKGVVKMLLPGTDVADSLHNLELAKKFPGIVYSGVGIHPSEAFNVDDLEAFKNIDFSKVAAIGETGIDLYHVKSNPTLAAQKEMFLKHLELARLHNKPVIVHARNAEKEVLEILKGYSDLTIIMHSFTGSWDFASRFLKLGAYISLSGPVTFKTSLQIHEVAKRAPLGRLLVETDAPFLTPVPLFNTTNKPENLTYIAEAVASYRTETQDEVIDALYNNALRALKIAE